MSASLCQRLPDRDARAAADCATRLTHWPDGRAAVVRALHDDVEPGLAERLAQIGFIPGEPVRVLRRGPGGREPLAVQVGDTMFALRWVEARCIEVAEPRQHD
ncbi:MAG: FeoA family protein [Burkholderiaceae bacterium]